MFNYVCAFWHFFSTTFHKVNCDALKLVFSLRCFQLGCQYHSKWLPGKTHLRNDLLSLLRRWVHALRQGGAETSAFFNLCSPRRYLSLSLSRLSHILSVGILLSPSLSIHRRQARVCLLCCNAIDGGPKCTTSLAGEKYDRPYIEYLTTMLTAQAHTSTPPHRSLIHWPNLAVCI